MPGEAIPEGQRSDGRYCVVNKPVPRVDAYEKVTGRAKYAADIYFPNMLYGKVLRSRYSHARILSVDTSAAEAMPGVYCVLTAKDLPGEQSWSTYLFLAGDEVRYTGDAIAMVAAETPQIAEEAIRAIKVEYEPLPGVYSIEEALAEGALQVQDYAPGNIVRNTHWPVRKGNVEEGFAKSDVIIEREYRTQYIEHAYIEPEAAVVVPNPVDGSVTVYGSLQNPFMTRRAVAVALGTQIGKVHVIQQTLGGSFGGKEEVMGLMCGRAAVMAVKTGRPVKMVNTREESFLESAKRHPFRLRYKVGATRDGKIQAFEAELVDEGGAYNSQAQFMNWRACVHTTGCYEIPNVKVDVYAVHTNKVYGGAMRGYSSPQVIFGQESLMDELAEALGMDPVELRLKNAFRPGSVTATGHKLEGQSVPLVDLIKRVLDETDFFAVRERYRKEREEAAQSTGAPEGRLRKGIGLAASFRGCGLGAESPDATGAFVAVMDDGSVLIRSGLTDNGQGLSTAHAQIVAEELGVKIEDIVYQRVDTSSIPDGGMTVASRGTFTGGRAMLGAAREVKKALFEVAARMLECDPEDLTSAEGIIFVKGDPSRSITFKEVANRAFWSGREVSKLFWFIPPDLPWDRPTGQGPAFPTYAYACVVAEVQVDMETGAVDVLKVTAGHDVGMAINPALAKGQIYGGIAMGMGMAIMEEVEFSDGDILNPNFDEYIIPTSMDVPEAKPILYESDDPVGPFRAKSLGEGAMECVAAAIANAVADATGRRIRELPLNLERVLLGKSLKRGKGGASK
ncbi:MAG TPA: xanthine dehydrogenase family protein [Clostridia bacterium]|nr:xanthine dehydrogenase family protein [Clostridia bacterium]